jgi:hypothetical protein
VAFRRWRRWPGWIGYAAGIWSLVYGVLGLYWALGGAGFPFGAENDPQSALSVLEGVRTEVGAPVMAVLGLASAVAALAIARRRGIPRAALLGFAWGAATVLALLIPDYRVLVAVAYTPIILIDLQDPELEPLVRVLRGLGAASGRLPSEAGGRCLPHGRRQARPATGGSRAPTPLPGVRAPGVRRPRKQRGRDPQAVLHQAPTPQARKRQQVLFALATFHAHGATVGERFRLHDADGPAESSAFAEAARQERKPASLT